MRSNSYRCVAMTAGVLALMAGSAMGDVERFGAPQFGPDVYGGYPTTHVLVRFVPGQVPVGDAPVLGKGAVDAVIAKYRAASITPVVAFPIQDPELASELGLDRWYKINTPKGTDVRTMATELRAFGAIFDLVELDGIGGIAKVPNDPEYPKCWGQNNTGSAYTCGGTGVANADVNAPQAWDLWTGENDITLAVIDSGVSNHVDLAGKIVAGWDTVNNQGTELSDASCPHGTHVSGTAAANGNNALGVAGMSWGAKVMPVRVLTGCSGVENDCGEGIMWAADHGANVATMSLQYYGGTQFFQDAVKYGWDKGMVVIAANGNNAGNVIAFPAKYPFCMGVGATTISDGIASFSNTGPECDLSAPGQDVWSSWLTNQYNCLSGTSMATPHTSGLACLLWSYNSGLTNQEVVDALIANVKDLGAPGKDQQFGWGRIDAFKTLENNSPGVSVTVVDPIPALVAPGTPVSIGVTIKTGPDTLVPGSEKLYYSINGGTNYTAIPLQALGGISYKANLPAFDCGDKVAFYVEAEGVTSGFKRRPTDAPASFYSYEIGTVQNTVAIQEGFNAGMPAGWTSTGMWHVTSACANGTSCDGGTYAYYGKDVGCNFNISAATTGTMTSPAFNLTQGGSLEFCYRYQGEGNANFDKAEIKIDGKSVWAAGGTAQLTWKSVSVPLTAGGAAAKMEIIFDSKDAFNNNFLGFQIDGVKVVASKVICDSPSCYPDCDQSGTLSIDDFICFQTLFAIGDPSADCDGDSTLSIDDFICFQTMFAIGC